MKSVFLALVGLLCASLLTTAASAGKNGAEVAQACVMCHGENGLSMMPGTPSLAGQSDIYLVSQLKQFRDGQRHNEIMNVIAKPLSDAEIEAVSAWFAQFEVVLKKR